MMTWPFQRGKIYNRRDDIHAVYGGQQQGGIITPAAHSIVILVTGKIGLSNGYVDTFRDDGAFEYVGEGQLGDMKLNKGNLAIATHSQAGKSLLLFEKEKTGLRYLGEWVCGEHRVEQKPDRARQLRDALVFVLWPLDGVQEAVDSEPIPHTKNLEELRRLAMTAAESALKPRKSTRTVYQRSADVRDYVLARAGDDCEGCENQAPFLRGDGSPYLEPHHLRRVSDGGPDDPRFVIGLCPNCHRRVHFGKDAPDYNAVLERKMVSIERR